jgi:hypothetical protein
LLSGELSRLNSPLLKGDFTPPFGQRGGDFDSRGQNILVLESLSAAAKIRPILAFQPLPP